MDRIWRSLGIAHVFVGPLVLQITWPCGMANRDLDDELGPDPAMIAALADRLTAGDVDGAVKLLMPA